MGAKGGKRRRRRRRRRAVSQRRVAWVATAAPQSILIIRRCDK
jgi:hypothetical protein